MRAVVVAVLMDLPPGHRFHQATLAALGHASLALSIPIATRVLPTQTIVDTGGVATGAAALIIGPGSPYREPEAVRSVIREARERDIPLVGTWGGFQDVLVEHARNLAGIRDASHAEYGQGGTPVITPLECSLDGQTITVDIKPGSRLAKLYGTERVSEHTTCSYGLSPAAQHIASEHGMRVVGTDATGEVRAIERIDHRFFVATLYQPALRSSRRTPHPVFLGLLEAAQAG